MKPTTLLHFSTGPDKASGDTRVARGDKIDGQAQNNPIVQGHADFKSAADGMNTQTVALKGLLLDYNQSQIAFQTSRSALSSGLISWDAAYNIFTSVGGKYLLNEKQANEAGLELRPDTSNQLGPPVKIDLKRRTDKGKNDLFIRVHRPKGMRGGATEISMDLTNPNAWKELDGDGATHSIPNPPPGTYAVRACCKTAHAKSEYFGPVTIVVK